MSKLKVFLLVLILIPKLALADRLICNQAFANLGVYEGVYTGSENSRADGFEAKGKGKVLFNFDSCQVLLDEGDD